MAYLEIGPRPRWPHPFLVWAVIGVVLIKRVVEVVNSFSFLFGLGQSFRTKLASTWSCSAASSRPFFLVDSITCKKEGEMKVGTTRVFCSFLFSGEENHFKIKKLLFPDNREYFCLLNKSVVVEYGICLQIFGLPFNPFFDVF